jgi:hypothetical protein
MIDTKKYINPFSKNDKGRHIIPQKIRQIFIDKYPSFTKSSNKNKKFVNNEKLYHTQKNPFNPLTKNNNKEKKIFEINTYNMIPDKKLKTYYKTSSYKGSESYSVREGSQSKLVNNGKKYKIQRKKINLVLNKDKIIPIKSVAQKICNIIIKGKGKKVENEEEELEEYEEGEDDDENEVKKFNNNFKLQKGKDIKIEGIKNYKNIFQIQKVQIIEEKNNNKFNRNKNKSLKIVNDKSLQIDGIKNEFQIQNVHYFEQKAERKLKNWILKIQKLKESNLILEISKDEKNFQIQNVQSFQHKTLTKRYKSKLKVEELINQRINIIQSDVDKNNICNEISLEIGNKDSISKSKRYTKKLKISKILVNEYKVLPIKKAKISQFENVRIFIKGKRKKSKKKKYIIENEISVSYKSNIPKVNLEQLSIGGNIRNTILNIQNNDNINSNSISKINSTYEIKKEIEFEINSIIRDDKNIKILEKYSNLSGNLGLSEFTKAYIDNSYVPDLTDFNKQVLDMDMNSNLVVRPELSSLTREYLTSKEEDIFK